MPKHFIQNQNSLSNLKPGNRTGNKAQITKSFIQKLTAYLETDFPSFLNELESLPVKDRVAAKIKLLTLLQPAAALNLTIESAPLQQPTWQIIEVSTPSDLS